MERDLRAAAAAVEAEAGRRGWNVKDLAAAAGVDPATITDLFAARRWPRNSTRGAIERVFDWPAGSIARIAEGGAPPGVSSSAHVAGASWMPPEAEQLTARDQRVVLAVVRALLDEDDHARGLASQPRPDLSRVEGLRVREADTTAEHQADSRTNH